MTRAVSTSALGAALLALLLPRAAQACAMCMAGQGGGSSRAFAIGSIFLSITPLAAGGLLVWYIRRRARAIAADEEAQAVRPLPLSRSSSSR